LWKFKLPSRLTTSYKLSARRLLQPRLPRRQLQVLLKRRMEMKMRIALQKWLPPKKKGKKFSDLKHGNSEND